MNIFKTFTLLWWQGSLFKVSMIALGILLGAYWSNFFRKYYWLWWILFLIPGIYITYIWWMQ